MSNNYNHIISFLAPETCVPIQCQPGCTQDIQGVIFTFGDLGFIVNQKVLLQLIREENFAQKCVPTQFQQLL